MAVSPGFRGITPGSRDSATGLAAVGGPRGTAAATLKILVELATQYDRNAISQLEQEVTALNQQQQQAANAVAQKQAEILDIENKIVRAKANQNANVNRQVQGVLNVARAVGNFVPRYVDLQKTIEKFKQTSADIVANELAGIDQTIVKRTRDRDLRRELNHAARLAARDGIHLDVEGIRLSTMQGELRRGQVTAQGQLNAATQAQTAIQDQLIAKEGALLRLRQLSTVAIQRMIGLAIGVAGYTIFGAAFAAGFSLVQGGIDKVTGALQDMIDPLRHIRGELPEVGKLIDQLVSEEGLTRLQAADKLLKDFGAFAGGPGGVTPAQLAEASVYAEINKRIDEYNKLQGTAINLEGFRAQGIDKIVEAQFAVIGQSGSIIEAAHALGVFNDAAGRQAAAGDHYRIAEINLKNYLRVLAGTAWDTEFGRIESGAEEAAAALDSIKLDVFKEQIENSIDNKIAQLESVRDTILDGINASYDTRIENVRSNTRIAIDRERDKSQGRIDAIRRQISDLEVIPSRRTQGLERTLENLGSGESARTRALAAAIEQLNRQEERRAYLGALADIAERRRLLILERRLGLAQEEINISKFSGEARVIALNAEIARLGRIDDYQDRQIKRLELMRRLQTPARRQSGETIDDFVGRRALENRKLLVEFEQFRRAGRVKRLQDQASEVEYNIRLRELEADREETIRKRLLKLHQDSLRARLDASKEADRKALEARRKSLQDQLAASKKVDQDVLESRRRSLENQINAEQNASKRRIAAFEDGRDRVIKRIEEERKVAIATTKKWADQEIDVWKKRKTDVLRLFDETEQGRLRLGIQGAKNLNDLALIAGRVFGANMSFSSIQAMINTMGLQGSPAAAYLMSNIMRTRFAYLEKFQDFQDFQDDARRQLLRRALGFQHGGVFPLTNGSTVFGQNIRAGEAGEEIGVILSNKVSQALKDRGMHPIIDTVNITTYEDPRRAEYRLRQLVREEVKQQVRR